MTKNYKKALFLSLLLHTTISSLFLHVPGCGAGKDKGKSSNLNNADIRITRKIEDSAIFVKTVNIPSNKKQDPLKPTHKNDKCDYFYGGIGIETNIEGYITKVIPGYPADKADFTVGMKLLNRDGIDPITGEIGTLVDIRIQESDRVRVIKLVRDKICYK